MLQTNEWIFLINHGDHLVLGAVSCYFCITEQTDEGSSDEEDSIDVYISSCWASDIIFGKRLLLKAVVFAYEHQKWKCLLFPL